MFDELSLQQVWRIAVAAMLVGAALGMLPRSRARSMLIWSWALAPVGLALITMSFSETGQLGSSVTFMGMFLLVALLPWAGLSVLPYNLIRRWREIRAGVDYGNGS